MTTRSVASGPARFAVGCLVVVWATCGAAVRAADTALPQIAGHTLIDVPYLSQTPELCGGAAVAMLMRYWGARDVFPQDFSTVVSARDHGILTTDLAAAVRRRGWRAIVPAVSGEDAHAQIQAEIDRGRPLIALIEVAARTYHYVVIVGVTDRQVTVHDPARAPFRAVAWSEFDAQWAAAGRWTMLVLPPDGFQRPLRADRAPAQDAGPSIGVAPTPCGALVDHGIDLARAGDGTGAEQAFTAATALCPSGAAGWQELAGLRFAQARWTDAAGFALSATRRAPDDAYSWQLLATSRYMSGDLSGALAAWNHTAAPHVDIVSVSGAVRTRQPVIATLLGLQPRQLLTPEAFELALRRVRDVPAASNARISYELHDADLANVHVFLDERPRVPTGWANVAILSGRALVRQEVHVDFSALLGAGDLESVGWRWTAERPRVAVSLALPSPQWAAGVLALEASWEAQSYAAPSEDTAPRREPRRRVGLGVSSWSTSWLKWQAGAALDRMSEYRPGGPDPVVPHDFVNVTSRLDLRSAGDRLAVAVSGGWWLPAGSSSAFATAGFGAGWRSRRDPTGPSWSAIVGFDAASGDSPLAIWAGAGTGQGRTPLLRAHPLLVDDLIAGPAFGRDLAHGTLEYERPVAVMIAGRLSLGGFLDAARAWHRLGDPGPSPLYVDGGIGLRVYGLGSGGAIRIDVAHGLRQGGNLTLSAGWVAAWPR